MIKESYSGERSRQFLSCKNMNANSNAETGNSMCVSHLAHITELFCALIWRIFHELGHENMRQYNPAGGDALQCQGQLCNIHVYCTDC